MPQAKSPEKAGGTAELRDGALEAQAAEEQVEAERGVRIANLQIGEKDDAQVQRMHAKLGSDGGNQRHHTRQLQKRCPSGCPQEQEQVQSQ